MKFKVVNIVPEALLRLLTTSDKHHYIDYLLPEDSILKDCGYDSDKGVFYLIVGSESLEEVQDSKIVSEEEVTIITLDSELRSDRLKEISRGASER